VWRPRLDGGLDRECADHGADNTKQWPPRAQAFARVPLGARINEARQAEGAGLRRHRVELRSRDPRYVVGGGRNTGRGARVRRGRRSGPRRSTEVAFLRPGVHLHRRRPVLAAEGRGCDVGTSAGELPLAIAGAGFAERVLVPARANARATTSWRSSIERGVGKWSFGRVDEIRAVERAAAARGRTAARDAAGDPGSSRPTPTPPFHGPARQQVRPSARAGREADRAICAVRRARAGGLHMQSRSQIFEREAFRASSRRATIGDFGHLRRRRRPRGRVPADAPPAIEEYVEAYRAPCARHLGEGQAPGGSNRQGHDRTTTVTDIRGVGQERRPPPTSQGRRLACRTPGPCSTARTEAQRSPTVRRWDAGATSPARRRVGESSYATSRWTTAPPATTRQRTGDRRLRHAIGKQLQRRSPARR